MPDFDEDQYPLEVLFIDDKRGGYLAQSDDLSQEYRTVSGISRIITSNIYLEINFPLDYRLNVGHSSGSSLHGKAKLADKWDTISFFGTDRSIQDISIEIFHNNKNLYEMTFRGGMSQTDDCDFVEEYIFISLCIPNDSFERILDLLKLRNVDKVFLSIKPKIINGLYELDSCAPYNNYKVLKNKLIVKNHEEINENFTDFDHQKKSYLGKDNFCLSFKHTFEQENIYLKLESIKENLIEKDSSIKVYIDSFKIYFYIIILLMFLILIIK